MVSHLGHRVQQPVMPVTQGLDITGHRPEVIVGGNSLKVEAPGRDILDRGGRGIREGGGLSLIDIIEGVHHVYHHRRGRGRQEGARGGEGDFGNPDEVCLLSPNPEALVFRPSPNVIAASAMSGEWGTSKWGEGEAATLARITTPPGEEGVLMLPANLTCCRYTGTGARRS